MRKDAEDEVALLTPIVKAFLTDNAWLATSHCMQVYGGHGYIREWGMEQFVRDARINMIYEGTNTVQSLDLLGRKVLADNGAKLKKFGKKVQAFIEDEGVVEAMQEFVNPLADLGRQGHQADHRTGHEGVRQRRRGGRRQRWTICAWSATSRSPTSGAHGQNCPREERLRRPVLCCQAGDRALLFRKVAAGNRGADSQRARAWRR